jgi:hypothetical protein
LSIAPEGVVPVAVPGSVDVEWNRYARARRAGTVRRSLVLQHFHCNDYDGPPAFVDARSEV